MFKRCLKVAKITGKYMCRSLFLEEAAFLWICDIYKNSYFVTHQRMAASLVNRN